MLAKRKRSKLGQEYPSARIPLSVSRNRINVSGQSFPQEMYMTHHYRDMV